MNEKEKGNVIKINNNMMKTMNEERRFAYIMKEIIHDINML